MNKHEKHSHAQFAWRRGVLAALALTVLTLPASGLLNPGGAVSARGYVVAGRRSPNPGSTIDQKTVLIDNRIITPVGRQSPLGNLPLNAVLSPDGSHLLVANSGAGIQSVQVVDAATGSVVQTLPYDAPNGVFVGLAYSSDGTRAYASGGGSNVVHTYSVAPGGQISATGDISMGVAGSVAPALGTGPWPAGLSVSPDGRTLYVADNLANAVSLIDTSGATSPLTIPVGSFPYTTLAARDGSRVYVSNWGDGTVSVIDTASKTVIATINVAVPNTVGPATSHPSAMALGPDGLLYVALSNSDAVAVVDTATNQVLRTLSVAPYAGAPLGSSPEGLAVSPDGRRLYVADAGHNDVAVFALRARRDTARRDTARRDTKHDTDEKRATADTERLLGRLPTAWYPTSVVVGLDGRTLYITNGKGVGAGPNGSGGSGLYPNPTRVHPPIVDAVTGYNDGYCNCTFDKYTGSMITGTLSTVEAPSRGALRFDSRVVARDNRDGDASIYTRGAGNPIPTFPGQPSPIKHVIYIIKENRTYDQVFGDEMSGNGDPSLTLFGRANTPNLHALAERFGLQDNFYANAEVSADGHNWAMSANASDYNEKMWPQDYSPGVGRNRGYDFEGADTINLSPGGYLWDAAAEAHITYRDYGEFYQFTPTSIVTQTAGTPCAGPIATSYIGRTVPAGDVLCFPAGVVNPTTTPNLVGHIDPQYRGYDLRYRESDRVAEWRREFNQFVANGALPQLEIMRLPNDHTAGTRPGFPTPQAFVAENDAAVGQVVDTVSHSPYWASTAIFITEDDAQNGPDHVDAHRTEALVISPYTSRTCSCAFVDHTLYDTAAMLRTMELILGLRPLSPYDANAIPMWRSFTATPDTTPYTAQSAGVPLSQVNTLSSYGARLSAHMDLSQEDRVPMDLLNRVIWHAVKGARAPYPVRAQGHGSATDHG